ncbi:alternate-type signal peptide domain-containing protein [Isoptericola sp. NPDC019482]|uniref:alternate-type signal peptide domain-containing protein n=1 Tax=Isoptericola sp. NPDC019482 TaxID=3154688 RepID=UPI00349B35CD
MTNTTTKKGAVKGTVAAAAGIAVLLGGAGTFAAWNADLSVGQGDTVTAGELKVDSYEKGEWTDTSDDSPITSIADFRMVPGDTLVRRDTAKVIAYGDNLVIQSDIDTTASIANEFGEDVTVDVTVDQSAIDTSVKTAQDLPVTVTVAYASTGSNAGQAAAVTLDDIAVKLTQVTN